MLLPLLLPGNLAKANYVSRNSGQNIIKNIGQDRKTVIVKNIFAKVSWYTKGLRYPKNRTTACWNNIPLGTKFHITFGSHSTDVVCTDRGHFKELDRYLDLSSGSFSKLAPLSRGIIQVIIKRESQ